MSQTVTLELSDEVIARAREAAQYANRRLEDVLSEWLERGSPDTPAELLTDAQVLAVADLQLDKSFADELSDLHDRQKEGELDDAGRIRLTELMGIYQGALLRKSEALKVAVQRGLRPRLDAE
jgi:hypothetical protein